LKRVLFLFVDFILFKVAILLLFFSNFLIHLSTFLTTTADEAGYELRVVRSCLISSSLRLLITPSPFLLFSFSHLFLFTHRVLTVFLLIYYLPLTSYFFPSSSLILSFNSLILNSLPSNNLLKRLSSLFLFSSSAVRSSTRYSSCLLLFLIL